jgi:hypothetical protein
VAALQSSLPEAYAAGGATSGISGVPSMVRLGHQRGPGPTTPNGAPAPAKPIAFASSLSSVQGVRREFLSETEALSWVRRMGLRIYPDDEQHGSNDQPGKEPGKE